MKQEAQFVKLPDGRRLAYADYGSPDGTPVIYCHGFPGSRLEAALFEAPARQYNLRVIAPERSGLGESEPYPDRRLLDWASDVAALADQLGIERFFLIGVSGGGPYAMACAYQYADRLSGISLVCPLGPLDQPGMLEAMRWHARINFRSISITPLLSTLAFRLAVIPLAQRWPQGIYQIMLAIAPPPDADVLNRSDVRTVITASIHEAIRQGSKYLLQEMALYTQPWGFDPADISLPVRLWHGTADETVPILHSQSLAKRLPNCKTHFVDGEGHFSLPIDRMDQIIEDLFASRINRQVTGIVDERDP
ncbi:MAG: alpha/beta hydrolase [Candidatus Thiodiazotropha sp. (ex Monitilora ramsayi)]|nr:alpha/beta hydrolase [Candidatus Thiodiazotropha sp. (ex Monitilora ramsayi)]